MKKIIFSLTALVAFVLVGCGGGGGGGGGSSAGVFPSSNGQPSNAIPRGGSVSTPQSIKN